MSDSKQRVAVAAAADLKFALPEIITQFQKKHPSIEVVCTFGASGTLMSQIANGAPIDMLLSADKRYPDQLREQGLSHPDPTFSYAEGHLVFWSRGDSSVGNQPMTMSLLLSPAIRKISIANPMHAPYGRAAKEALQSGNVWDQMESKLVIGENVAQAAQYAETGASDIAIIALSLARAESMQKIGRFQSIPEDLYKPIEQYGTLLKRTNVERSARLFRDYLLSAEGRTILRTFGLGRPDANRGREP